MNQVHSILIMVTVSPILATILISLVSFIVVLLLLRLAAKVSWLTSIAVSMVATTIPSIFGVRILADFGFGGNRGTEGLVFFLPVAIGVLILLIQFFCWLLTAGTVQANVNTAERSRILKMVENGKINTGEGSELLDAMGRSSALQGQDKFSRLDIAMLVGLAMVIVTQILMENRTGYSDWIVLLIGVLSAVSVFVTPSNFLYKISMLQIFLTFLGLTLVISTIIGAASYLYPELTLCLVGFAVALISSAVKLKRLAA